ncbi:L,D-transpeptidase family protein [Rhizorhabdus sp. FW153]|uniref:L,D-transpeptidase family protein n=1 Tax=Rhizorhabdus sp. FW153 TaxID=3400216 RepID=UPI003CF9CEBA
MSIIDTTKPKIAAAASTALLPRPHHRFQPLRLLAALPLVAVTALCFDGVAPAGTTTEAALPAVASEAASDARWSQSDLKELLKIIDASAKEGLDPTAYAVAPLRQAAEDGGSGPGIDALAHGVALALANDFANGAIDDKARFDWKMPAPMSAADISTGLDSALAAHRVDKWLTSLLPKDERYAALKVAYAKAVEPGERAEIRANLERWRWMPRDLGQDYLYVNIPSYRLSVIADGVERASYNVVVGSPRTPTPQLALHAQSIVANPGWSVPRSISSKGMPKGRGFEWKSYGGNRMLWQAPGPTNALGRIKIDMPNPDAIYLHDTPNHSVFRREHRALSHGCVRVENIEGLAALLHDEMQLNDALADQSTTRVFQLQRSIPVYLTYFTLEATPDGRVTRIGDPYKRDSATIAQLGDAPGRAAVMAAR